MSFNNPSWRTEAGAQRPAEIPELSSSDFDEYNRFAEQMDLFHSRFREAWETLYSACTANCRPSGMSMRQFLSLGLDFCHNLNAHHSVEEHFIFPRLAYRMPEFRKQGHLLGQHEEIHKGLDLLQGYLKSCKGGERELRLEELKEIMDGFGKVLWAHLDDEVRMMGAENMRRYWSLQEMRRMKM